MLALLGTLSLPFQRSEVCYNLEVMDLQVREMTKEQAADLMAPLEGSYRHNSRPLQQLNGRTRGPVRLLAKLQK